MDQSQHLVSVIMPAYNAGPFLREAVESVLAQDHQHWELILVNDGSTDDTASVAASFTDPRITVIHQENRGISGARNRALEKVRGEFLVTLDADDVLTPNSLSSRLSVFDRDPGLSFVDGAVLMMDRSMTNVLQSYSPSFLGEPFDELLALSGNCFFGPTWMVRIEHDMKLRYDEDTTHAEDLLLYLTLAKGRRYGFTDQIVLYYRRTGTSAMSNLDGLARGYRHIVHWLKDRPELVTIRQQRRFARKCDLIMAKSYLRDGRPLKAFGHWVGIRHA